MKKLFKLKSIFAVVLTLLSSVVLAQDSAQAIEVERPIYEKLGMSPTVLFMVMFSFTVILLIALVSVANTTKNVLNFKRKKMGLLIVIALLSQSVYAQDAVQSEYFINFSDDAFWAFLIFDVIIVMVILYLIGMMKGTLSEYAPEKKPISLFAKWNKKLTNAVEIEEEDTILLDHDYDGIQELDNDLPPWWKYGFYITIVWGGIYFFYYQVLRIGPNQEQELAIALEEGEAKAAKYKADHPELINEDNVTLLTDAGALGKGKTLFQENCVACHAADGGGGIGPNLTDKYWIYDGDIKGVFHTITEGAKNGMKSWKNDFNPVEIQSISSYILSLEESKAGKEPQGENIFE